MKKYLLLCLVAGTTLFASMQTYAIAPPPQCQKYDANSPEWTECMIDAGLCWREPDGTVNCVF
ncbi:hypothetical protein Xekj_00250 [Xenorhabdus sp. KJ12.1]|nr:hypothetical protein Xekj_00250 [Xenorhabdus sp. KJ12.1]